MAFVHTNRDKILSIIFYFGVYYTVQFQHMQYDVFYIIL